MRRSAEPLSAVLCNELTGPLLTSVSAADTDSRTSYVASSFKEKTTRTSRHFVLNSENQAAQIDSQSRECKSAELAVGLST